MDKSSDSYAHVDNMESSWLTSIKEKAVIQYPITPESSLIYPKEELACLDLSIADSDGVPRDVVS